MSAGNAAVPLLATKLYRPAVAPDFIAREGLVSVLQANAAAPLTLVSAPAGYGKSTLVSSWLSLKRDPVAWLSLDDSDNDPRLFLTYWVAALRTLLPDALPGTWKLSQAGALPPIDTIAAVLINDLDELDERVVLVLDDYHRIRDVTIHSLLEKLLEHPSPHLSLVLLSRRDPPVSLATLRAKGKLSELRLADLMFARDETAAFLETTVERDLDAETVDRLHELTEGWPVALRLTAVAMRNRDRMEGFLAVPDLDSRSLREFLVSEVLSTQSQELRTCLLSTSLLDRFCAPLCEAVWAEVSGVETTGADFLETLEGSGLFCVPLDSDGHWVRYHHLFADLLKSQLSGDYQPAEIAALHRAAAGWFDEHGYVEEAVKHALLSGDVAFAATLLGRARHELMNGDEWARLERLYNQFPLEAQAKYPELILLRYWLQMNLWYNVEELVRELLGGESPSVISAVADESRSLLLAELAALMTAVHYSLLEYEPALATAATALSELPANYECVLSTAMLMKGAAVLQFEGSQAAERFFDEQLRSSQFRFAASRARLLQGLCFVHLTAANTRDLRLQANRMLKQTREAQLGWAEGFAHYFLGAAAYDANELEEAIAQLSPVVSQPYFHGLQHHAYCGVLLSLCRSAAGEYQEADDLLAEIADVALDGDNRRIFELCEALRAWHSLGQGQSQRATAWLDRFEPVMRQYRTRVPDAELMAGRCMTAMGADATGAVPSYLQGLETVLREQHHTRLLLEVLGLQAKIADDEGDREAAERYLLEAVDAGFQSDLIRPLADLGSWISGLLNRLSLTGEKLEYVGRIIAASQPPQTPDRPDQAHHAGNGEVLSQRELEILSLFADNLTNKEIGDRLFISTGTVKRHAHNIYGKLSVAGRRDAVAKATGLGLL